MSLKLLKQVTGDDPEDPVSWMNLALVELARGDSTAAAKTYHTALQHILYNGASGTDLRVDAYRHQQAWLAGGITDLDDLATATATEDQQDVRAAAAAMKELLATALATSGGKTPTDAITIDQKSVQVLVTSESLEVEFDTPTGWNPDTGEDLRDEAITLVWYERPNKQSGRLTKQQNAWNAIAEATEWGKGEKKPPYNPLAWDGSKYFDDEHFLFNALQCLPSADYKVEIYLNGHLAATKTALGVNSSDLVPAYESDMSAGFCRPPGWKLQSVLPGRATDGHTGPLSGIIFGYATPDGNSGAYAFRIYPNRKGFTDQPANDVSGGTLDYAVQLLEGGPLPDDMAEDHSTTGGYFMNLDEPTTVEAIYKSATSDVAALVGSGQTDDDAILVAVVFGPQSQIADPPAATTTLEKVFQSVGQL